ncbi:GTP cyclohydrolase [Capnocytophaga ochracea]
MPLILIKELTTKKELTEFVKFPLSLYKNNPYWVPPLISDEVASFDKTKNPVFDNAEAFFYGAYNEKGKMVGRVVAIINQLDLKQNIKKVRFGWLDMIDDIQVTQALLDKVAEKAREYQLEYMEGPIGFSNMDKVGLLTEGYDHLSNMMTWYNYPYYNQHLEQLGFTKEKGFVEMEFLVKNSKPEIFKKTAEAIKKRYGVKFIDTPTTKEVLKHVDAMFDLYNETYSKLASYVPISERQREYFKQKYIPFINPEYIRFIEDKDGKLICFAIVMPSFSKALQKAKGKLFPWGWWYLLQSKRHHDTVEFYLIGVAPEYQSKGIPALLFDYYYDIFTRNGVTHCVITPELEENIAIQQLWKSFDPVIFARRATFKKQVRD